MEFERSIDDVVEAIKKAKLKNIKVNLLIGAGCSVSAGIPSAAGMLNKIMEEYPREYERATPKDYSNVMSKLTPPERRNLIMELVTNSKVNWAHVAIAQLLKHHYIDRILTTNFDNLLQRACSLVGEFPAIYDLASSKDFRTDLLFDKSILHLHGQYTGFILCNTQKKR
jgi:NAD-dependent SIR2 family protein deacetylase